MQNLYISSITIPNLFLGQSEQQLFDFDKYVDFWFGSRKSSAKQGVFHLKLAGEGMRQLQKKKKKEEKIQMYLSQMSVKSNGEINRTYEIERKNKTLFDLTMSINKLS